ncbi:3844_t:CDS:2 [Funneliformis caledonium]|uniref:3844_t:CDS:1 n=1 Tax=Funneliformis caledonium TaxID=1117310 RepID=A0A9N9GHL3_9GLOM|nr:3844_t:CDS:2 [Funneliformis caledonium]
MNMDFEDTSFLDFMLEVMSKGVDNVMRWLPGAEVVDIDGRPLEPREYQPTLWNFLYSNHLYLAIFVNVLNNRINAIVSPRNPRPLSKMARFLIRLPCFYLIARAACVLLSRLAIGTPSIRSYFSQWLFDCGIDYTDHQALWLTLKALSAVYVMKAFHSSLENRRYDLICIVGREQSTTLYEYALLFHYFCNVTPNTSNTHLLLIAFLEVIDIFFLEVLYLHPRGIQYRLIPTTIVGVSGIIHYAYALFYRSETYPILQSFARFPELALIAVILICVILHIIAYIVTGGNVRRTFFLDARSMPSLHEDYTMALYRIGTIVIETNRVDGFRNEFPPIAVPLGTIFERSKKRKSRTSVENSNKRGYDNEQQDTNDLTSTESEDPRRVIVWSSFVLEIIQVFINVIMRFVNWIWSFYGGRQIVQNNQSITNEAGELDEIDWDEEIYHKFLYEDLEDKDEEEDDDYVYNSSSGAEHDESDLDSGHEEIEDSIIPGDELILLGNDLREQRDDQQSASTTNSIMQSMLAHLLHSTTLTRTQYRRITQTSMSSTSLDESDALMTLIHERRIPRAFTTQPITDRVCVVCHGEARQCLLKPCGCFALCNECREMMAQRKFKSCPCCRRTVEGYSRVYIP